MILVCKIYLDKISKRYVKKKLLYIVIYRPICKIDTGHVITTKILLSTFLGQSFVFKEEDIKFLIYLQNEASFKIAIAFLKKLFSLRFIFLVRFLAEFLALVCIYFPSG